MTDDVQLTLLGGFELSCCGEPVCLPLGSYRLLGYLALQEGCAVCAAAAQALWPVRRGGRATANLRSALWQARSLLRTTLIDCLDGRIRLSPGAGRPTRGTAPEPRDHRLPAGGRGVTAAVLPLPGVLSGIRWNDLHFRTGYDRWLAYAQSKAANALFAVHLAAVGASSGLRAFSVHPGSILTPLQRHAPRPALGGIRMDKNITVTVDDVHRERIEAVADPLRAAEMRVHQVLPTLGIITGTMPESRRCAIANVAGVAQVEDQEPFQLPPPDADIQ